MIDFYFQNAFFTLPRSVFVCRIAISDDPLLYDSSICKQYRNLNSCIWNRPYILNSRHMTSISYYCWCYVSLLSAPAHNQYISRIPTYFVNKILKATNERRQNYKKKSDRVHSKLLTNPSRRDESPTMIVSFLFAFCSSWFFELRIG